MLEILEWLETTPIALVVRESDWGFHYVVGTHIMGLAFAVGTLVWIDLRLMGVVMNSCPAATLQRRLLPWSLFGFAVMFTSGIALFIGFATKAVDNTFFWLKMLALVLAAVNALVYHRITKHRIARWDDAPPPAMARMAAITSLLLWATVILCGRMMSYTMFSGPG